jgi:DNA polymerase III sliding clamp (beta) subunit (PCNA family)
MLNALKFVKGSLSSKDVVALAHFVIEKETIRGYNGVIALCAPIPINLPPCKPRGDELVKAIGNCRDSVNMALTTAGRLAVTSGKFKAFINCIEGETPHVVAEGEPFEINGKDILAAFKTLFPIVGNNAAHPWSGGILLDGKSAFATNNIILAEYWLGSTLPHPVNIPKAAIKEMIRIGEEPIGALVLDQAITFLYPEGRWLRSQLLATTWPDIRAVLDKESNPVDIDDELFEALETIKPFTDDKLNRVHVNHTVLSTHTDLDVGASYELHSDLGEAVYTIDMLLLLKGFATSIDWTFYPKPCPFFGDRVRGVIIGLRI